jgi:hypothetical protein
MHTSLEIICISFIFALLLSPFTTFASVLYQIRTSSRRRELVYLIQHGRECCKCFLFALSCIFLLSRTLYNIRERVVSDTNFEPKARISIPDTTRPRMLQILSICSFVYFSIISYHLQHSRACCIRYELRAEGEN